MLEIAEQSSGRNTREAIPAQPDREGHWTASVPSWLYPAALRERVCRCTDR
nr:hypothetical protein OG781_29035 [Streptomyces sp. NBC_00830]